MIQVYNVLRGHGIRRRVEKKGNSDGWYIFYKMRKEMRVLAALTSPAMGQKRLFLLGSRRK